MRFIFILLLSCRGPQPLTIEECCASACWYQLGQGCGARQCQAWMKSHPMQYEEICR